MTSQHYSDTEPRAATGNQLREMTVSLARQWNPKASELLALSDPETLSVTLLGDAIQTSAKFGALRMGQPELPARLTFPAARAAPG